ncbi:MAG: dihydroorotase [Hyphomicrobiaceae bacterium]
MTERYDLVLTGATVVNHDGESARDIGIRDGRIAALGAIGRGRAETTLDLAGLHVLPGVIDTQVHFREPGAEHKEDLESGSRAAVMGGVTAVFEMPNTKPETTDGDRLADKVRRATGRMHCDFAFFVGATSGNLDEVPALERLPGAAGIKVFRGSSTGDLLLESPPDLDRLFARLNRRAAFHAENEARLRARLGHRRDGDPASHPVWRDAQAALEATVELTALAERHGKRIHILHVSTADEMAYMASHKALVSVEVTPHHLTLAGPEDYARLGTLIQMNPPVRDASHREALWQAVADGTADILGSDHAPHTLEEKAKPYPASPSGMAGVQTLVPVMLNEVGRGRLSLARFVDMTSHGPARLFNLAGKGRIAAGYDADLTVVDLKRRETITNQWIASRCGWTPYDGLAVTGWPVGTFVRGRRVMWQGELVGPSSGRAVRFAEAYSGVAG